MTRWLLLVLIAAATAYIVVFGPRVFATSEYASISPKGYYRIEYWKPGFPYLFSLTKDIARFVRLYDNRTGKLIGETEIVDLSSNGQIFWPSKYTPYIIVGVDIQFPVTPEPD
jgi:hypothetical protein